MAAVRGAPSEAHREEREHGCNHVAARLHTRRDEAEAARGEAHAELQRYEHSRSRDRRERGAPLLPARVAVGGVRHPLQTLERGAG